MMIPKEELEKIIERIEQGIASEEDLRNYNAWCNARQEHTVEQPAAGFDIQQQQLFREINRKIDEKKGRVKEWVQIAAAVILLAAGVAGLLQLVNRPAVGFSEAAVAKDRDVAPGTNMATLVLADGQKMILSETGNGVVTEQMGTVITKTTDSTLVYKTATAAPAQNNSGVYNTLITARAQQYQLTLPDGSKVWLNAASSVKYPVSFSGLKERRVELEGEAYFEVAKDASKPFIVHSRQQDVKVLGTHFNVSSYADEQDVKTTLLEGSVKINGKLTLKPGEQAQTAPNGKVAVSKINGPASIAWQKGYFEFNEENVYEIMGKVARWYDVEVIYQGAIPMDKMKGAMSRFQNVSGVLAVMQATGLFTFTIEGKRIYVRKS